MEPKYQPPYYVSMEAFGERKLARYYPLILVGLVILYIGSFPIIKAPIFIVILAVVAGWFYYQQGGVIATFLAIILNLFLINTYQQKVDWEFLFDFRNGILFGHALVLLAAIGAGSLRKVIEQNHWTNKQLHKRERHLILTNMATKDILEGNNLEDTYYRLLTYLTNLFTADCAYLARFDETTQNIFFVADTKNSRQPFDTIPLGPEEAGLFKSVLNSRRVLFIDDRQQPPHVTSTISLDAFTGSTRSALLIPLATKDNKFGVVLIAFYSRSSFTQEELERAEQAGNQVALALWSFLQSLEIQQRLKESNTLAKISRALSEMEHVGSGEVLQLIVDSARELMPHAEKSVIHLLEVDEQILFARAVSGYDEQEKDPKGVKMRLGEGVAGQVIREGVTINLGDIRSTPGFLVSDSPPRFQSLLVAPVQSGGQQIGTISVHSARKNAFSAKDADLLNALGIQAAIAIENTRLFEATQQRLKEVNILYQISRILAASLDADQLIKDVVSLLHQIFGYYHVQIYLIEPETGNLVIRHGSGFIGDELVQQGYHLPAGEGIAGHVAETRESFFTNNVDEVVFFKRNELLPLTQSEIAAPIKVDKQVVGVLDIHTTPQQRLTDGDFQLMIAVADQLAVSLQKARLYGELQTSLQQEQNVRSQLMQSERLALVGRLLASVSHELNNPLQAIQNALFLLKEETGLSNQGQQDLDIVLSETDRMTALFERLRSAYRPIHTTDFQPVQLNNLIEDVYALIGTHMRHKAIVFEFIPEPDLSAVPGISDQLRQVVLNLFLNAIEVMSPGGILTVHTRNLREPREVLFSVKDSGPGIAPELLTKIFDAFITSKQSGTGLGLTITRDIIEQHHGRIEASNHPEGGAIFNIWLPAEERGEE